MKNGLDLLTISVLKTITYTWPQKMRYNNVITVPNGTVPTLFLPTLVCTKNVSEQYDPLVTYLHVTCNTTSM